MSDKILPLTPNLTLISADKVLDKRTGNILSIKHPLVQSEAKSFFEKKSNVSALSIGDKVDFVYGLESTKIDLQLKTSDGISEVKNGFLIEVYLSGSDGKIKRLFKEDIEDPLDGDKTISDGFDNYFILEVDV